MNLKHTIAMRKMLLTLAGLSIIFSCTKKQEDSTIITDLKTKGINLPEYTPANKQLYDTIVALDNIFWEAYNTRDTTIILDLMTDDHEFYHDMGGALISKEKNAIQWKEFLSQDLGILGETVAGTNEIYEIPDYGALQLSYQRFYRKQHSEWTTPARAIVLWKKTPKGWLQSRVFSLHQDK
jgi:hypothetical protein